MDRIQAARKEFEEKLSALVRRRKLRIFAFRKKLEEEKIGQLRDSLLGK